MRYSQNIELAISKTESILALNPNIKWLIAYSGGKDSTATLKIFVEALRRQSLFETNWSIIYCDTGVESIVLDQYIKPLLQNLELELKGAYPNFSVNLLKAPVGNRFFVKIIGRGYPPPTNTFRWCTKYLRINPVQSYISSDHSHAVLLGTRRGESQQRDRTFSVDDEAGFQWQREGKGRIRLFLPVQNLGLDEVWEALFELEYPVSIDPQVLSDIYKDASGECPTVRGPNAPPCASGRFGCWTCTVVRKDKSARKLIEAGYEELVPYLKFRDWLAEFRNDRNNRWAVRRNGSLGSGPFTISARQRILEEVRSLEATTGVELIDKEELEQIYGLWADDTEPAVMQGPLTSPPTPTTPPNTPP